MCIRKRRIPRRDDGLAGSKSENLTTESPDPDQCAWRLELGTHTCPGCCLRGHSEVKNRLEIGKSACLQRQLWTAKRAAWKGVVTSSRQASQAAPFSSRQKRTPATERVGERRLEPMLACVLTALQKGLGDGRALVQQGVVLEQQLVRLVAADALAAVRRRLLACLAHHICERVPSTQPNLYPRPP